MNTSDSKEGRDRDVREGSVEEAQLRSVPDEQKVAAPKGPEEAELFAAGTDPQYFGTGSYGLGGSNQEGNYGLGESNPQGGYGTFTDSGGYGATTLYGLDVPPAQSAETDDQDEQRGTQRDDAKSKHD